MTGLHLSERPWSSDAPDGVPRRRTEAIAAVVKGVICRVIVMFPVHRWAQVSKIVRCFWPGFKRA